MSRRIVKTALALGACAVALTASLAQSGTIESVEVQGLVRMTSEAFAHAFAIRAGDPYDPARIRTQYAFLYRELEEYPNLEALLFALRNFLPYLK